MEKYKTILMVITIVFVSLFGIIKVYKQIQGKIFKAIEQSLRLNPNVCLNFIQSSKWLVLFFRKSIISMWKMDIYMILNKLEEEEKIINNLDSRKLMVIDDLEFCKKKIAFYVSKNDAEKAQKNYEKLKYLVNNKKIQNKKYYDEVVKESEELIEIYIKHNVNIIEEIEKKYSKETDNLKKGIIEYRLAKLYYFKNDEKKVQKYLKLAANNLKNTSNIEIINKAIKDNKTLEYI